MPTRSQSPPPDFPLNTQVEKPLPSGLLAKKLTIWLSLLLLLSAAVGLGIAYFQGVVAVQNELQQLADNYEQALSNSLEMPLWQKDQQTIRNIGAFYTLNRSLHYLRITASDGKTYWNQTHPVKSASIQRTFVIRHRGNPIGRVEFSLSITAYQQLYHRALRSGIIASLASLGIALLLLPFVLRQHLYRPLKQLRTAEKELKTSEQVYRDLFENAQVGILQLRWPEIKIQKANNEMTRILGYTTPEQVVQEVDIPLIHQRKNEWQQLLRTAETVGAFANLETTWKRRDKQWIQVQCAGQLDKTRGILNMVVLDITERHQVENSLRQAQQRLVQQERLSALGRMAGEVAHEFNNALMPIQGFAELMQVHLDKADEMTNDKVRRYAQKIRQSAKDVTAIVRRMEQFYSQESCVNALPPLDLVPVIQDAVEQFKLRMETQTDETPLIKIRLKINSIPIVSGNAVELREAIVDLLMNAEQAMPDGGEILLQSRVTSEKVIIQIQDTGKGMTDDVRSHCFEPFFTTRSPNADGLGLSIVFGVMKRHGGTIEIHPGPETKGTMVTLRFPRPRENEKK